MKTKFKILLFIPLLWLSGCYTQIAVYERDYKDYAYQDEGEYAEEDSLAYNQDSEYPNDYDYYRNSGYRRFLFGYIPSLWYTGYASPWYNRYWWTDLYGYNYYGNYGYLTGGYYYPWGYYGPHVYGGWGYYGHNHWGKYKYRSNDISSSTA
ncbi:MAG: hypothetical protein AB1394_15280, partial [Bacteroidota bacterium]